jgi:hypothetical protein
LTEFFVLNDRRVAAFDLADEGPQLSDYLPQLTTVGRITDIYGQVSFFEQVIADLEYTKIIDLSYRYFELFFNIIEQIGFFEEAGLRSVEPIILFITEASSQPPGACATLRQRFTDTLLLPVRNRADAMVASSEPASKVGTARPSLQIPLLPFPLQAQIDRQDFSFRELWQTTSPGTVDELERNVRDWTEGIFRQFRAVEIALGRADVSRLLTTAGSEYVTIDRKVSDRGPLSRDGFKRNLASDENPGEVHCETFNFLESVSRDGVAIDQYGDTIINMVQRSGRDLRAAKNRIEDLEMEIDQILDHAKKWLQLLEKEIEKKR